MTSIDERLRNAASDVRDAAGRTSLPHWNMVVAPRRRQRVSGWAVAAMSTVLVLAAVGGVAWIFRGVPEQAIEPTATTVTLPVTTTAPESLTPTTGPTPAAVPTPAAPISGDWVVYGVSAGLPGTPADTVAVDASGGIWVLAHMDDPTTAQLYSLDAEGRAFVARGEPLQLFREWGTTWMEAASIGVVVSLSLYGVDENEERSSPPERLLQWDEAGWHELSRELDLPDLDMSIAQRTADGGLIVAGYTSGLGPVTIAIAPGGVTYSVAPEGTWSGGGPSVFSIRLAVVPMAPDGRSWFSDAETSVAALGAGGYDVYDANEPSGCCYVPLAADESGVWAYFGSELYRYDQGGWRVETLVPPIPHGSEVAAVVVMANGDVWILGRYVAARLDPDANDGTSEVGWTVYTVTEAQAAGVPLISHRSAIARDGDNVWIASWSNGLTIWRHDGNKWAHVDLPDSIDQDNTGFRQNTVIASSGDLWVATSTGVARFIPTP